MADDDDDPQLRSLRSAWRSLPDEDPPERGLAELMAAARQQADVMAEAHTPWWRRALVALMRPPMLALASVIVLLGGVFVVTSSHKGVSPEPAPVEDQSVPMAAPPVAPTAPAPVILAPPIGGASAEPTTASAPEPAPPRALATPPAHTAKPVRHASPAKPSPISDPFASPRDEESRGPGAPPPAPVASPSPAPQKLDGANGEGGEVENKPTTRGAVQKVPVSETSSTPRAQLDDQLLAQCRAAASRGDCELAKKIAQRIANDDAAYYSAHVTTDATIAACLGK